MIELTRTAQHSYTCRCGRQVFFRNSICLGCKSPLGYEPYLGKLFALTPGAEIGSWQICSDGTTSLNQYHRCGNLDSASGCNWLVPRKEVSTYPPVFCKSCRLDRTIPDLSVPSNATCYARIGIAKRRLVALLVSLRLPVASKQEETETGLSFDFLRTPESGPKIVTGHEDGIITLNIEEAEDATRERIRSEMGEPYRTILGHLRHEVGHYYWDRLIAQGPWLQEFREIFGDERKDYVAALANYYQSGKGLEWADSYISAYASSHPWEDWAETWAHYLHMIDTLNTALGFGLDPDAIELDIEPFKSNGLNKPGTDGETFLHLIQSWTRLTSVLNELSRAISSPDFYPFVLCERVAAKLHFIHWVISQASSESSNNSLSSV